MLLIVEVIVKRLIKNVQASIMQKKSMKQVNCLKLFFALFLIKVNQVD